MKWLVDKRTGEELRVNADDDHITRYLQTWSGADLKHWGLSSTDLSNYDALRRAATDTGWSITRTWQEMDDQYARVGTDYGSGGRRGLFIYTNDPAQWHRVAESFAAKHSEFWDMELTVWAGGERSNETKVWSGLLGELAGAYVAAKMLTARQMRLRRPQKEGCLEAAIRLASAAAAELSRLGHRDLQDMAEGAAHELEQVVTKLGMR